MKATTFMPPPFVEFTRRLRWADADAAGRLHFPRIFEIVEEAETELTREATRELVERGERYDLPRVHVEANFRRIIKLDAEFRLRLTVGKLGRTSIRYDFQVFDETDGLAIDGTMTVVVLKDGKPTAIPEALRVRLSGA